MRLDKPLNLDFESQTSSPEVTQKTQEPQESEPPSQMNDGDTDQRLTEQLDELNKELQAKNRILDAKNQEISELKIKNRQLNETNNNIQARQKVLEDELGKAEAQIELIQELLLKDEDAQE